MTVLPKAINKFPTIPIKLQCTGPEIAQKLRAVDALAEDPNLISSNYMVICNSSSRRSSAAFCPPQAPGTHVHMHVHNIYIQAKQTYKTECINLKTFFRNFNMPLHKSFFEISFTWKHRRSRIARIALSNKHTVGDITLPNFKLYHTVISSYNNQNSTYWHQKDH